MVSFAQPLFWQIRYIVNALTKKNLKPSLNELHNLIAAFGYDAQVFFLRVLLEEAASTNWQYSGKGAFQLQVLSAELKEIEHEEQFGQLLCHAIEQFKENITEDFLLQLCKATKISLQAQINMAVAMLHSLPLSQEASRRESAKFLRNRFRDFTSNRAVRLSEPLVHSLLALLKGCPTSEVSEGDPLGFALTLLGVAVVLLGFGFVYWVFTLSPAKDETGRAKASSLQGLEDIEKKLEIMDKMTPEEADEYQMRRGGLQKERKDAKGEQQEFEYQAIPGCDTVYTVLKEGAPGATVEPGDEVTVHATGLVTATKSKFWSTKDAGQQPFTYICGGGVIKGWDMGARGMKKGEARGLRIPAGEGYGGRGFPSWGIPPNADLLFEIEVLAIKRNGQQL
ncbi:unnamed protein product [Durusdinium trenchii]|uniref:peptidylprolyl isomerase n=1 Tax=Durusdinium trenchii TaxID=1381693 RepID=A0ABP0HS30_9DINO